MLLNKRDLILLAAMFLITVFAPPAVFGQMGSGATYSDTWLVGPANQNRVYEENEPITGYYMVGLGVTDESYNNYGHACSVRTTLTSPNGQTASGSFSSDGSYAQVEATIDFDFDNPDVGDFSVFSEHGYFCPIAYRDIDLGSTFDLIGYGFSQACYIYEGTVFYLDFYSIADDCYARPVSCPGPGQIRVPAMLHYPNHVLRWQFFLYVDPANRFCIDKWVLKKAPNGCDDNACKDFPALPQ